MPAPPPATLPSRGRYIGWALLYALVMLYASTVPSPAGFFIRPLSFAAAVQKFQDTHWWINGSDQRADWTANLLLMVPLAFMIAGGLWPRRLAAWRLPAMMLALAISVAYVLGVKFAQIFFPRTVSINYIVAQSSGAAIGVLAFALGHRKLGDAIILLRAGGHRGLLVLLGLLSFGACAYALVPFDLVLSQQDAMERVASLRQSLFGLPGDGRPTLVRAAVLAGGALLGVPIGMLLEVWTPGRPIALVAAAGLVAMAALTLVAMFIISTHPALLAIPIRAAGVVAGALLVRAIAGRDLATARKAARRWAPWLVLPYLLLLLELNGLLSLSWRAWSTAGEGLGDPKRLFPLFTYYNISKAQATASLVVHAAMFAPAGLLLWAGSRDGTRIGGLAALIGLLLAAGVETGRMMKPGLVADINNPAVGLIAAWLTAHLAPSVWAMISTLRRLPDTMPMRHAPFARVL